MTCTVIHLQAIESVPLPRSRIPLRVLLPRSVENGLRTLQARQTPASHRREHAILQSIEACSERCTDRCAGRRKAGRSGESAVPRSRKARAHRREQRPIRLPAASRRDAGDRTDGGTIPPINGEVAAETAPRASKRRRPQQRRRLQRGGKTLECKTRFPGDPKQSRLVARIFRFGAFSNSAAEGGDSIGHVFAVVQDEQHGSSWRKAPTDFTISIPGCSALCSAAATA